MAVEVVKAWISSCGWRRVCTSFRYYGETKTFNSRPFTSMILWCVFRLIGSDARGVKIVELCGPERLTGVTLALRLARKYIAAPVPVWWPAVTLLLKALGVLGFHPATPDQISRLVGPKTASVSSEECGSSQMIQFPQNATV